MACDDTKNFFGTSGSLEVPVLLPTSQCTSSVAIGHDLPIVGGAGEL